MTYTPPSLAAIEAAIGSGQVDPEDPPAETAVRVIADIGGTATPQILVAETSQTGLTASIGRNDGSRHRLPAAELFRGARIERGDHWYELYTPARYRALTESNSDARSPAATYPEPTHEPTGGTHAASEDVSRQGSGEPTHLDTARDGIPTQGSRAVHGAEDVTSEVPMETWSCGDCGHTERAPVDELAGKPVTRVVAEGTRREHEVETVVCPECEASDWNSETVREILGTVEAAVDGRQQTSESETRDSPPGSGDDDVSSNSGASAGGEQ